MMLSISLSYLEIIVCQITRAFMPATISSQYSEANLSPNTYCYNEYACAVNNFMTLKCDGRNGQYSTLLANGMTFHKLDKSFVAGALHFKI